MDYGGDGDERSNRNAEAATETAQVRGTVLMESRSQASWPKLDLSSLLVRVGVTETSRGTGCSVP